MLQVACVFLPLLGAIIAGCFGRKIGDRASRIVCCVAMGASAALAIPIFIDVAIHGNARTILLFEWFASGDFHAPWALKFDTLSAVMVLTVTVVATAIHVYSCGYMSHDKSIPRFMAYLNLFTFFMLMLVTAANFMQLFFGWEGVGLLSYLLIGFWFDRPSANAAAIKAFLVNRVGDFGFALGIMGTFLLFGSIEFDTVFPEAAGKVGESLEFLGFQADALTLVCLLLFVGAMGKSAQIILHTWLPDAMEGPTPVSALIHAATMVTAGVFMVSRLSPMFEYAPDALAVVTVIGATTAFFAATIGLVQNDIKRVIAYSTCSQLGYMFFAVGVSAYPAAIFHLMTHAYFKALLFLGAGSVIHAMSDEQDMRKMGGIWRKIPFTYAMMWIGSLALAGIPLFAGFYSKDMIIESAWGAGTGVGQYAFVMGVVSAALTAFYSWRLIFLTFHGKPRADHHTMEHVHESSPVMLAPLAFLSLGAIFAGWLAYDTFVGRHMAEFWRGSILILPQHPSMEHAHEAPLWLKLMTIIVAAGGIVAAYYAYMVNTSLPARLATMFRPVYLFLYNKWYFDELYNFLFVRPAGKLGRLLWKGGDGVIIDGLGPNGLAITTVGLARRAGRLQTGYVYHYAFAMLIGVVGLVTWYLFYGRP
ncbi:MAG: NADH-quinone oxidoreductase subunit L [Alphaproteobacteria bacterium]